jgi:pilus assembly protein CpaE
MRRSIRAILFNRDDSYRATLRSLLLGLDGVHIVAEADDPAMIGTATAQFPADLLVVHLDPAPEDMIAFVRQVLVQRPDLPVFAISECNDGQVILTAMRAGIREYLTKPVERGQLETALERIAQHVASRAEPGRIISVMSSVGGGGATTIAVNLAVELANLCEGTGRNVALVDLDYRFGQVSTMLDVQPQYSIADLCDTPENVDPALVKKVMVEHASGVHILARPQHFAQSELITAAHCAGVLSTLQDLYKYVIIDGPTRFDLGAKAVLDLADMHLMVMHLLVPSVRTVHRILDELSSNGYNLDRVKLICNRAGKESGYLEREQVEATLDREMFFVLPDDWKTVSAAVNMGVPLSRAAPKTRICQAFMELATMIHEPPVEDEGGDGQRAGTKKAGSLLSKIFS